MKAYVLMNVRTGKSREVVDKIRQLKALRRISRGCHLRRRGGRGLGTAEN